MIRPIVASVVFLISSLSLAQSATPATRIVVPSQFATAKTVFIGYAGDIATVTSSEGPAAVPRTGELLFTELQGAIAQDGRYQVVAKPSDADLSMRLSIQPAINQSPNFNIDLFVRLAIYDTKTGMLLWTLDEPISWDFRGKNLQKNIDQASANLLKDLSALSAHKLP
jgi:hypothetical protein